MRLVQATLAASVGFLAIAATASATNTVATFSDPSGGPATPLFAFNSGTGMLTGGWGAPGLLLQTPGLPFQPDFNNATFTMTPLSAMSAGPIYSMGAGQINFFDSSANPLMTITFASAMLTSSLGLGASDFAGFNVSFSGPILAGYLPPTNESFSFSFANPASLGAAPGFTVTSSFTSSAELVTPAPGAAALLGLGGLLVGRRRR